jgi:hypothetical protein
MFEITQEVTTPSQKKDFTAEAQRREELWVRGKGNARPRRDEDVNLGNTFPLRLCVSAVKFLRGEQLSPELNVAVGWDASHHDVRRNTGVECGRRMGCIPSWCSA